MRERLEKFKALCEAYDSLYGVTGGRDPGGDLGKASEAISTELPTVHQIAQRLDPALVKDLTAPSATYGNARNLSAIAHGLGILRDMDEWKANLEPDAPSLIADQFHPSVWKAASAIWDTGMYRVAVQQAAVSLSAHIAAKAGSPLTERALVNQVFSKGEPQAGQVRLHMPGDKTTETWRSRQDGLHLVAQGAFAGIRNVATHTADEWKEQVALEHLAALSVVARWTDETVLVRGE